MKMYLTLITFYITITFSLETVGNIQIGDGFENEKLHDALEYFGQKWYKNRFRRAAVEEHGENLNFSNGPSTPAPLFPIKISQSRENTQSPRPLFDVQQEKGKNEQMKSGEQETWNLAESASTSVQSNGKPRKRQKLLIGYLTGAAFSILESLVVAMPSARSKLKDGEEWMDGKSRNRRWAHPKARTDPRPLEHLRVFAKDGRNTSKILTIKDLAHIFHRSDITSTSKYLQGHAISGAIRYAVEFVNNDPNLLPDYELTFKFCNTKGLAKESVKWVMELWKMGAVAFIGPEDSCQHEAIMAAAQNLPMISYKCADHSVSDKTKYSTFARTVPAEGEVTKATVSLLKQFKWHKFTIICQADEVHRGLANGIMFWVEKNPPMTVQNTTFFKADFNLDTKSSSEELKRIFQETHKNTRVYVILGDQGFVQLMLLEMGSENLLSKGEYAVVYVDHTFGYIDPDDAAMHRYYRPTTHRHDDAMNIVNKLAEYSRNLFVVVPTPVSFKNVEYQKFWSTVVQYNTEEPFRVFRSVSVPPTTAESSNFLNPQEPIYNRYASYLYDAVLLYARALHETLQAGGSYTNGTAIMQRILGRKYRSMQGFDVKIDMHGDAKGNFTILTRQNISNSRYNFTVSMVPTGWFVDTADPDGLLALSLHDKMSIDWVGGKPPSDEPECGFQNERCFKEPSRAREIAGSVLAILALASAMVAFMIYRNRKIEKELAGLIWKIDPKEIHFMTTDGYAAVLGASRATLASQDSTGQENASLWPVDVHCLAKYRGALVAIKEIQYTRKMREITRATKMEMKKMRNLHHDNVNNFMGIIVKTNQIYVVREYCAKGSLYDVLLNENIKLDELFIASFIDDLLKAMCYLHESEVRVHGNLKSTNCVVTSRWSLQVADYGLHELRDGQQFANEMQRYKSLLWTAPELLLAGAIDRPQKGTQKGDVFSFGIIMHEIFTRTGPYGIESDCGFSGKDIYMLIVKTRQLNQNESSSNGNDDDVQLGLISVTKPFLPSLDGLQCQNYVKEVLLQCWDDRPFERPDFRIIRQRLKSLFKGILRRNIMDHMMAMMEKYQNHLEQLVDERTEALNEEKKRVETLLHRMLPDSVATQLMRGEDVIPESYDAVTIYFSDIVGFTSLSAESTPMEVVNFLNALYTLFDSIIRRYDVYKVETIGDAYMVVSGLPIRNGDKHAGEIATMALHLLKAIETFQIPHRPDKKLLLRIGLHTGPCVAGVVGKTMPRYCLFGDTVNTASRMESNGMPLKIHCSEYVERALAALGGYILEERGLVPMKGKGEMLTYWLLAKQEFVMASPVDEMPSEPLFKTKDTTRPPTGNMNRRRIAAESLHQLPSRGESLTTILRRTPSKRIDSGSTSGSRSLQPVPAFSSTAGKAVGATVSNTGGGSSRSSRIFLPTTATDYSNPTTTSGPSDKHKMPPSRTQTSVELPPLYRDCVRGPNWKRPSLRSMWKNCRADSGCRLTQGLTMRTNANEEGEGGMRKRSVSFPENVQTLAEQFVSLGLEKDGRNVMVSSSLASSPFHTPRIKSRVMIGNQTRPNSALDAILISTFPNNPYYADHMRRTPSENIPNGSVVKWEKFDSQNEHSIADNVGKGCIDASESADDDSDVPRKRSLSCGDAENFVLMIPGPSHCQLLDTPLGQSRQTDLAQISCASLATNCTGNTGRGTNQNHIQLKRSQNALFVENPDENSPCDSPLLLKAETSLPLTAVPDERSKRKRKSAISLQTFSRPFHNIWHIRGRQGENGGIGNSSPAVDDAESGGENGIYRFLRYVKRPMSDDRVELGADHHRHPSLV